MKIVFLMIFSLIISVASTVAVAETCRAKCIFVNSQGRTVDPIISAEGRTILEAFQNLDHECTNVYGGFLVKGDNGAAPDLSLCR